MFQKLDLRYRTSSDSDEDRATAIFSGAVLVYRAASDARTCRLSREIINEKST